MMNMSKGTIGRNIFGEVCTEKFLKLNKETAVQQYMDMMKDIVSHGSEIEYTVDSTCFTPDEAEESATGRDELRWTDSVDGGADEDNQSDCGEFGRDGEACGDD